MTNTIPVTALDLSLAAVLVLLLALATLRIEHRLAGSILLAAFRTTVQLLLVGLILRAVFAYARLDWVIAISLVMVLVAGVEVMARQERRFVGLWGYGIGGVSLFLISFALTLFTLAAVLAPDPWYSPRYAIPLLGMIIGNTMTGIALALDSLTRLAYQQRAAIEARLMLGHGAGKAIGEIRRQSVHSGLMPTVNAMAAAGIVSLPGMMTGQILAGNPPMEAVKYQILIMFLIAAGTGYGTLAATWVGSRRLFDGRDRLCLDRLTGGLRR